MQQFQIEFCKIAIVCRYVPVNLENVFSKYALTVKDKLSFKEVWNVTEGNRMAIDPFGWLVPKTFFGY